MLDPSKKVSEVLKYFCVGFSIRNHATQAAKTFSYSDDARSVFLNSICSCLIRRRGHLTKH